MSLILYSKGEEQENEESIDKYKYLFLEYENNLPTLYEALYQMFISSSIDNNKSEELIQDILYKCKQTIDYKFNDIKNIYNKINRNEAYIICSYTCESIEPKYSPYKILNENLISKNRKEGIQNISKYLYILLKSLRKLRIYHPKHYLFRCIKNKVKLEKESNDEKWVPYAVGNQKTFWSFTSTSPNIKTSLNFLQGKQIKYGTIFLLGGEVCGYDITLFNFFKEEEILIEPERKYIIDSFYSVNDITNIVCRILKSPLVLDDNCTNNIYYKIGNKSEENNNNIFVDSKIKKSIVNIEMEIKINKNYKYISGIGFFFNIPSKNLKALITYSNIIDEEFLNSQKKLIFFNFKKEKIEINLEITRYTNILEDIDISVIEILEIDKINDFIEIDDYINSKNYNQEDIILIEFNGKKQPYYINEKIILKNGNFFLNSKNQMNSGILLLQNNFKAIGIINNIKKDIIPLNKLINKINYIKSLFCIKERDLGEEIQILNKGNNEFLVFDKANNQNDVFEKFIEKNISIDNQIKVLINGERKKNLLKYRFKKEGIYKIYYILESIISDMSYMFYECSLMKEINFSAFITDNITNMSHIFYKCSSLKKINFSLFNTESVSNMSSMFLGCSSLKELDLSSFNTEKVTDMSSMFWGCLSIENINLSSFITNNLENMSCMFVGCESLKNINLRGFNTNKVTNMALMFWDCSSLNKIDLSSFNTNNVITMSGMFSGCISLNEINLNSFNTKHILKINMESMFEKVQKSCKFIFGDNKKLFEILNENNDTEKTICTLF